MPDSIDVVVPVHDEEAVVEQLVERIRRSCPAARVIFVDNASTDRTCEILEGLPGVDLVRHTRNLGYGRSLQDGIAAGRGELVVMIDADLEYHPEDIPALVAALETAPAVYGSRLARSDTASRLPWLRRLGNRCVSGLFNLLFSQHLTDLYTGIRGIRRSALPGAGLESPGFEFVLELAARLAQAGVAIAEVPVGYTPRSTGRSKMRHLPELLKFAAHLLRLRLRGADSPSRTS